MIAELVERGLGALGEGGVVTAASGAVAGTAEFVDGVLVVRTACVDVDLSA